MEYVDKEEHDAKIACSGMLLSEYLINADTGEIEKIQPTLENSNLEEISENISGISTEQAEQERITAEQAEMERIATEQAEYDRLIAEQNQTDDQVIILTHTTMQSSNKQQAHMC